MLFNNVLDTLGGHVDVGNLFLILFVHLNDGLVLADADTTCLSNGHAITKLLLADGLDKGVQNVLVSLGADGAILTDGKESYFCKSASVAVNSTVGAGDSMVAAACVGLLKGVPMHELLKMSVAAGTASVTTSGTNLFYKDKYNEIYSKIFSQKM